MEGRGHGERIHFCGRQCRATGDNVRPRLSLSPSTIGSSTRPDLVRSPEERHGQEVAIVGAGISGMIAAHELMKLGLKPVLYEASHMGGRLRSQQFESAPTGVIAELGGMRFPVSSTAFYHYVDLLGLPTAPFPNPLTRASNSTVINIEGTTHYAEQPDTLPALFQEVARSLGRCAGRRGVHQDSGCDPSP